MARKDNMMMILAKCKFFCLFFENLLLARFLCWRDISRDLFFAKILNFFHIGVKKTGTVNQVINEIFKQMTITFTLPLDVPVRPMDTKGFI